MEERRRSRRLAAPELPVAIERTEGSGLWVADALDISGDGLGMVLSPEFAPGTEILLTFQLDETTSFLRVPAVVLRQELGTGAVRFREWSQQERHRLLSYILRHSPVPAKS